MAIDLATDTLAKTYSIQRPWSQRTCPPGPGACAVVPPPHVDSVIVDGALWVQWNDSDLQRFDLNSGEITGDVTGIRLVGDDSGSVWVQNSPSGVVAVFADGPLPAAVSSIDDSWGTTTMACGSIWQIQDSYLNPVDTVTRIDPQTGATLWEASIPGSSYHPLSVIDVGSTCWAAYSDYPQWHLTRLGSSCVTAQTMTLGALPFDLGDTTWTWMSREIYQFDIATGATYGPGWLMPFSDPSEGTVAAASGQVWADDGDRFVRLAIPLSPIPNQATLAPLVCATASPSLTTSP